MGQGVQLAWPLRFVKYPGLHALHFSTPGLTPAVPGGQDLWRAAAAEQDSGGRVRFRAWTRLDSVFVAGAFCVCTDSRACSCCHSCHTAPLGVCCAAEKAQGCLLHAAGAACRRLLAQTQPTAPSQGRRGQGGPASVSHSTGGGRDLLACLCSDRALLGVEGACGAHFALCCRAGILVGALLAGGALLGAVLVLERAAGALGTGGRLGGCCKAAGQAHVALGSTCVCVEDKQAGSQVVGGQEESWAVSGFV